MPVATTDAFRNINVQPDDITVVAEEVGDTLTLVAGTGIGLIASPTGDQITIVNTGNGTGAYTEITDTNANLTYYPLFSRPFAPGDINPLDVPPSYQLDTIYVDNTTTPITYNPLTGTLTAVNFTGSLTGNADTVTNGVYTSGSYSDPSWLTISKTFVGLGNVENTALSTWTGSSSITTVGTLTNLTVTNTISGSINGNAATATSATSAGKSTNLVGGNNTTLLGSVPYQSNTDTTSLLAPNTTTTKKFLRMTGDGTNGAVPAWDTPSTLTISTGLSGSSYNGTTGVTIAIDSSVVTRLGTQTLLNKRVEPRYNTYIISGLYASHSVNSDDYDLVSFVIGCQLQFLATTGTPELGERLTLKIKDNGTPQTLIWTSGVSNSFRAVGVTLPTTTVAGKITYVFMIYNYPDQRWDVIDVKTEA